MSKLTALDTPDAVSGARRTLARGQSCPNGRTEIGKEVGSLMTKPYLESRYGLLQSHGPIAPLLFRLIGAVVSLTDTGQYLYRCGEYGVQARRRTSC